MIRFCCLLLLFLGLREESVRKERRPQDDQQWAVELVVSEDQEDPLEEHKYCFPRKHLAYTLSLKEESNGFTRGSMLPFSFVHIYSAQSRLLPSACGR